MAIQPGYVKNFETMLRAAECGDLAIIECTDVATGKPVITVCAVNHLPKGEVEMIPMAKMFDGNPFEELVPPPL